TTKILRSCVKRFIEQLATACDNRGHTGKRVLLRARSARSATVIHAFLQGRPPMSHRSAIISTAAALLFGTSALIGRSQAGYAGPADFKQIKASVYRYVDALWRRDIGKMGRVWSHADYAMLVSTRSNRSSVGWNAIKKQWEDGVFGFWSDLKVTMTDEPRIHVNRRGSTGWAIFGVHYEGHTRNGQALAFDAIVTQAYEWRRNSSRLMTSHTSRAGE